MDKRQYRQEKYEYYQKMNFWAVVSIALPSMLYYFSDCYLMGGFYPQTIIPRTIVLIPFGIFMIANHYTKDYRIMVPLSYLVGHGVMWGTIWACTYLENLSYACVGFFIILFIFLGFGIAAPLPYEIIGQGLLFVDIAIANTFLHYPDFAMMYLLGLPLYLGIVGFDFSMEVPFRDQRRLKLALEEHLKHDVLTGTFNRNVFHELTDETEALTAGLATGCVVAMYDIDKFKSVNDTYGHASGDKVLIAVSETFRTHLMPGEYLIRWGGEEFVLLLHGELAGSRERLEQMRRAVEDMTLSEGKITVSIGATDYQSGESYQEAVGRADQALYVAKNSGRNQVKLWHESM